MEPARFLKRVSLDPTDKEFIKFSYFFNENAFAEGDTFNGFNVNARSDQKFVTLSDFSVREDISKIFPSSIIHIFHLYIFMRVVTCANTQLHENRALLLETTLREILCQKKNISVVIHSEANKIPRR